MRPILALAAIACVCVFNNAASAADEKPQLLEVGKQAPNFSVTGVDGKSVELKNRLEGGKRNVVLIFSRANW